MMARLVYSTFASLDGFVTDTDGRFDWAEPDAEVHMAANDLMRTVGTHVYGRRMYETMLAWESPSMSEGVPPYVEEFARMWRDADKIVYSTTLEKVSSARTTIERHFDADALRRLKTESDNDLVIGGPTLAAHAIGAGLVDEYHLFVVPVLVGGGLPTFSGPRRATLELLAERTFGNGMVYLRYSDKDAS